MKTYADTLDEQARAAAIALDRGRFLRDALVSRKSRVDLEVISEQIREADSYFVGSEFTDLAITASLSLDTDAIEFEYLPAETGWITFESGIPFSRVYNPDVYIAAETEDERLMRAPGAAPHRWDHDTLDGLAWLPIERDDGRAALWVQPFTNNAARLMPSLFADIGKPSRYDTVPSLVRLLKSLLLLMGQKGMRSIQEARAPRMYAKRAERNGVRSSIRIIRLPRVEREGSSVTRSVEWNVRWIVSGHWRQQPWGPERKRIRPVWIAPYLKGPEDKPLVAPAHRLFVAKEVGASGS